MEKLIYQLTISRGCTTDAQCKYWQENPNDKMILGCDHFSVVGLEQSENNNILLSKHQFYTQFLIISKFDIMNCQMFFIELIKNCFSLIFDIHIIKDVIRIENGESTLFYRWVFIWKH